jgi:transcriptional regulator with XRE-family HTH domain
MGVWGVGMEVLAKRLKWLREKQRYAQKDIAKKIGMTQSGYQKIEYGERDPKLDVLVALCDIFEVSADFLLGRNNSYEELNEILEAIKRYDEQIMQWKISSSMSLKEISKLRDKMMDAAKRLGFLHEETVRYSELLDEKIDEQSSVVRKLDDLESGKKQVIFQYIKEFLEVPESNAAKDQIVSRYAPYKIIIQMNIYEEFDLLLLGEEIGKLGDYGTYKTEDEAVRVEEEVLKRLNSRN